MPQAASAGYIISSAIIEFTSDGPRHQDIEVISQSEKNDYVVAEVAEITHPGEKDEGRHVINDFSQSALLVSPDKMVLAGRSRKVLRFILLKEPDAKEHIYRVAIKPVIKSADSNDKIGLKVLIGYEVLVIIRPQVITTIFQAQRHGKTLAVSNSGNSNILLQGGQQCQDAHTCTRLPVIRVYPGQQTQIPLPADLPATYSVWDGKDTTEKQF
jgi:P pilus assembly chaperone PapD